MYFHYSGAKLLKKIRFQAFYKNFIHFFSSFPSFFVKEGCTHPIFLPKNSFGASTIY